MTAVSDADAVVDAAADADVEVDVDAERGADVLLTSTTIVHRGPWYQSVFILVEEVPGNGLR
ncbi:hypothetical protein GCM10011583_33390 [Streptomyces camponoticapitis]|uniref:Uncharacterized protein n=1 Tax=Streptomyces camponoticapitis TaxID=1616125 RepID=A0ABQ2E865_9ACTN|nr:hypothetical protein GCM10011583_33390 [Streptomyces camponoticapitis]